MHVRTRRAAGCAYFANDAATRYEVALFHIDLRHVAEHADKALTVIDEHGIAVEEIIANQDDLAGCRGFDRCACRYREVQTGVRVAFFSIEEAANPELAG